MPIYRAHGRLIGPQEMVRDPDDVVKTHKRVKRSGWWMAGIADPESVAQHSFRTALLGYILASLEGADPQKTAIICLFHDMGEARINDLHRVAKRYIDVGNRKEVAFEEQAERLPQPLAEHVVTFMPDPGTRIPSTRPHRHPRLDHQLLRRLQSDAAKSIADACLSIEPGEW